MADFDTLNQKLAVSRRAANLLAVMQGVYQEMKSLQASLVLYQAGTDPAFNAAVNALYTASERTKIGQMIAGINTLVADWETNHAVALQQ